LVVADGGAETDDLADAFVTADEGLFGGKSS